MSPTASSRQEMINQLVENSLACALSEAQPFWLREIFENGFVGYRHFTDRQLALEMQFRGLGAAADIADEEAEDESSFDLAGI